MNSGAGNGASRATGVGKVFKPTLRNGAAELVISEYLQGGSLTTLEVTEDAKIGQVVTIALARHADELATRRRIEHELGRLLVAVAWEDQGCSHRDDSTAAARSLTSAPENLTYILLTRADHAAAGECHD
jgi:hypothetical protein